MLERGFEKGVFDLVGINKLSTLTLLAKIMWPPKQKLEKQTYFRFIAFLLHYKQGKINLKLEKISLNNA